MRICFKICGAVYQTFGWAFKTFGWAFEDFRRLLKASVECLKSSVTCLCYSAGHVVPISHYVFPFASTILESIPRKTLNLDSTLVYIENWIYWNNMAVVDNVIAVLIQCHLSMLVHPWKSKLKQLWFWVHSKSSCHDTWKDDRIKKVTVKMLKKL